jgi:hypothetical protein
LTACGAAICDAGSPWLPLRSDLHRTRPPDAGFRLPPPRGREFGSRQYPPFSLAAESASATRPVVTSAGRSRSSGQRQGRRAPGRSAGIVPPGLKAMHPPGPAVSRPPAQTSLGWRMTRAGPQAVCLPPRRRHVPHRSSPPRQAMDVNTPLYPSSVKRGFDLAVLSTLELGCDA